MLQGLVYYKTALWVSLTHLITLSILERQKETNAFVVMLCYGMFSFSVSLFDSLITFCFIHVWVWTTSPKADD